MRGSTREMLFERDSVKMEVRGRTRMTGLIREGGGESEGLGQNEGEHKYMSCPCAACLVADDAEGFTMRSDILQSFHIPPLDHLSCLSPEKVLLNCHRNEESLGNVKNEYEFLQTITNLNSETEPLGEYNSEEEESNAEIGLGSNPENNI